MNDTEREKLQKRLDDLKRELPAANAAFNREFDKNYETPHLQTARDRLNGIESEIESIHNQLSTPEIDTSNSS